MYFDVRHLKLFLYETSRTLFLCLCAVIYRNMNDAISTGKNENTWLQLPLVFPLGYVQIKQYSCDVSAYFPVVFY